MVGMLFNNILYCFSDIYIISYILDFIIGNSITTTFLLYASKGLAGTALGLGIGGLAVSLLNNGCNPLGIFGRNCGTNAGEVAIVANEQYLERKQCADFVKLVNGM